MEVTTKCSQLKLKAQDGKLRETNTLDTKGILRLIESILSPKAELFKMCLAYLENERIDYYRKRGYPDKWIETLLK